MWPGLAAALGGGVMDSSHTHAGCQGFAAPEESRAAQLHLRRGQSREEQRFLDGKQPFLSLLLQLPEVAFPSRPSPIPGSAVCAHTGRNCTGDQAAPEKLEPRLQASLAASLLPMPPEGTSSMPGPDTSLFLQSACPLSVAPRHEQGKLEHLNLNK